MLPQEMISEIVNGILNIFGENVQQIILYGSVARREETDESDIDIAIVLERKFDTITRKEFISWAANMDLKYEKVFSIIDIERDNLNKWGRIHPFYKNVCEEGIVLWRAA